MFTQDRVSSDLIIDEGTRILKAADEKNVVLRFLGAVAFRLRCSTQLPLYKAMGRELSDLDFLGYSDQSEEAAKVLQALGYALDKHHALLHPERHVFYRSDPELKVDIFYDKLEMCHTIDFRSRLKLDHPTIPLADMLLEKMQIVKMTEKDAIDTVILLLSHEVGKTDGEVINSEYVAGLLSNDWGFYYTVTTNLVRVRDEFLPRMSAQLGEQIDGVRSRIDDVLSRIEQAPKSMRWKMRAKVGPRKIWYNEVEELNR